MQQVAVITLGIADIARSERFYGDGFDWTPVFRNAEILFYQMNGLVLGLWLAERLAADSGRAVGSSGGFALAHNVRDAADVNPLMERLVRAGGTVLQPASAPPHGGMRGYVSDPDGHAWEIAFNPIWPIDADGHVRFAL